MAKTQKAELSRINGKAILYFKDKNEDYIAFRSFCWGAFKRINPVISKGLRNGQTRKLKRTQLKNGFKLERIK